MTLIHAPISLRKTCFSSPPLGSSPPPLPRSLFVQTPEVLSLLLGKRPTLTREAESLNGDAPIISGNGYGDGDTIPDEKQGAHRGKNSRHSLEQHLDQEAREKAARQLVLMRAATACHQHLAYQPEGTEGWNCVLLAASHRLVRGRAAQWATPAC